MWEAGGVGNTSCGLLNLRGCGTQGPEQNPERIMVMLVREGRRILIGTDR